jgi:F0F1-type ATP synthase assembly protein I
LPNVKDEPRSRLARAVLLGARIVTAVIVGSGALFGPFFDRLKLPARMAIRCTSPCSPGVVLAKEKAADPKRPKQGDEDHHSGPDVRSVVHIEHLRPSLFAASRHGDNHRNEPNREIAAEKNRGGAHLPNVKDEPRSRLARAVLLGAQIVTAVIVGSGALFGILGLCQRKFSWRYLTSSQAGRAKAWSERESHFPSSQPQCIRC